MNLSGYTFYGIFCAYGYFIPGGTTDTGNVDINDLIGNLHNLLLSIVIGIQALVYPLGANRASYYTIALLIGMWVSVMVYSTLTLVTIHLFRDLES